MEGELIKPVKGEKYVLTYFGRSHSRGTPIHQYTFQFICHRGRNLYFYAENGGIDLTISKQQFNTYLKNTIEQLQNR